MKKINLILIIFLIVQISKAQFPTDTYWTDVEGLHFFDFEKGLDTLVVSANPGISDNISLETVNQKIYYLTDDKSLLNRIDYDGGNRTVLFNINDFSEFDNTFYQIETVEVHPEFPKLFITLRAFSSSPIKVYSIDIQSGEVTKEWETDFFYEDSQGRDYQEINDLKIDPVNNRLLYIRSENNESVIVQRDLEGNNPEIIFDNIKQARQLAIHEETQSMFFTGGGRGYPPVMYKASLEGTELNILFENTFQSTKKFILEDYADRIYFYDLDNEIISCNLNGSDFNIERFPLQQLPEALDLSIKEAYYVENYGQNGSFLRGADMDFPDSYVVRNIIVPMIDVYELSVDQINERIFFRSKGSNSGAIFSMDFDGGNIEIIPLFGTSVTGYDWVLDANDGRVITLEKKESGERNTAIYSRNLDNLSATLLNNFGNAKFYHIDFSPDQNRGFAFASDLARFNDDVVYDFKNDNAYYLVDGEAIYKSNDPSTQGEQFVFFEVVNGDYLIKDERAEELYWSNTGSGSSRGFFKVNFDGSNVQKIGDNPIFQASFIYENQAPVLVTSFEDISILEDSDVYQIPNLSSYFSDPEGSPLTINASTEISSVNVSVENNVLSISLDENYNGTSEITISATDGYKSVSTAITLIVQPVNDPPSLEDNVFFVEENSSIDTVIDTLFATDPENDNLTFSIISGNELGAFQVNSSTAEIIVADETSLDFETNPSFELTVDVTDGELSAQALVTINLIDLEDEVLGFQDKLGAEVKIFPNPTNHLIIIEWLRFELAVVTELSGKQIMVSKSKKIDISHLKAGSYLITLIGKNDEKIVSRIVKK